MKSLEPSNGWNNDSSRVGSAYNSTYTKSYTGSYGAPAPNARVQTSQFYPSGRPDVNSTYRTHYAAGEVKQRVSVPFGSASRQRKNNPHPHNMIQAFAHPSKDGNVWCHYPRLPPVSGFQAPSYTGPSSDELLRKVCQDKIRSTYQTDFVVNSLESPFISIDTAPSMTSGE